MAQALCIGSIVLTILLGCLFYIFKAMLRAQRSLGEASDAISYARGTLARTQTKLVETLFVVVFFLLVGFGSIALLIMNI